MWPITWGADDNLYAGAGDNDPSSRIKGLAGPMWSPMNFWRINGEKMPELVDNLTGELCLLRQGRRTPAISQ